MAGLFSKLIDGVVGRGAMERTRDYRMDAINQMYDPSQLDPLASRQRSKAIEGMDYRVEQQARRQTSNSLFAPMDTSYVGGNAARALSMQNMRNTQGTRAMAQMETNLALEDQRIRDQYGDQYVDTTVQQGQLFRQRAAGIAQENATFNEELSMRRRQLGSAVAGLAVEAGAAFATGGASLLGRGVPQIPMSPGSQMTEGVAGRRFDFSPFGNRSPIPQFTIEPLKFTKPR